MFTYLSSYSSRGLFETLGTAMIVGADGSMGSYYAGAKRGGDYKG